MFKNINSKFNYLAYIFAVENRKKTTSFNLDSFFKLYFNNHDMKMLINLISSNRSFATAIAMMARFDQVKFNVFKNNFIISSTLEILWHFYSRNIGYISKFRRIIYFFQGKCRCHTPYLGSSLWVNSTFSHATPPHMRSSIFVWSPSSNSSPPRPNPKPKVVPN